MYVSAQAKNSIRQLANWFPFLLEDKLLTFPFSLESNKLYDKALSLYMRFF